jgi:hypothetical protein
MQMNSAFDLRLDHVAIDGFAQMGIGRAHWRRFAMRTGVNVKSRQSVNSQTDFTLFETVRVVSNLTDIALC